MHTYREIEYYRRARFIAEAKDEMCIDTGEGLNDSLLASYMQAGRLVGLLAMAAVCGTGGAAVRTPQWEWEGEGAGGRLYYILYLEKERGPVFKFRRDIEKMLVDIAHRCVRNIVCRPVTYTSRSGS